ncbi:MAG: nuclear transport factor 2 family protein [Bryobacteraceae bacterium]|nr:nuclear transport factor 2 family protein [Bryobacteraceae bacterium]
MKKLLILPLLILPVCAADPSADREGVRQAVLDYVEGVYNVQPERIERSVHPELAKRGFWRPDVAKPYQANQMTYERLVNLAGAWNKDKKKPVEKFPKEIVVLDVLDQTAAAKLTAEWGIDYFHLAKYDGKWKIINVLWQSHPSGKP